MQSNPAIKEKSRGKLKPRKMYSIKACFVKYMSVNQQKSGYHSTPLHRIVA